MSRRVNYLGILLTTLIISGAGSMSMAQETPSQSLSINPSVTEEHEAVCRELLNYQKLFINPISADKKTVEGIKQLINDIAADRDCIDDSQSNPDVSTKLKTDRLKNEVETASEKNKVR